jgi:hypothetical protein
MIWIVASLPLWVLGICLLVLPAWGIVEIIRKWRSMLQKETESAMVGIAVLLICAALVLALAAKVVS